eukprot:Protomagalhaensia_wolfi_Nauph_80__780@NODE_144_length_3450_cov_133_185869_g107_i0_p5_GENE_NODE_144_length_3450_cov_133_185869_g107_i0NODE_144_length_3450_cov_133_185869_g107_i0_p5_ORF_typecomplete_len105_score5_35_NODE_144_length_3450_cov_133_185869_g107_i029643278
MASLMVAPTHNRALMSEWRICFFISEGRHPVLCNHQKLNIYRGVLSNHLRHDLQARIRSVNFSEDRSSFTAASNTLSTELRNTAFEIVAVPVLLLGEGGFANVE